MNKLEFIACDVVYSKSKIALFGAPMDQTVSFRSGSRFAPNEIRLDSDAIETYSPYQDKDLEDAFVADLGDVDIYFGDVLKSLDSIYNQSKQILLDDKVPFLIGGEHLVTLPQVEAVYEKYPDLRVIHFDAHTDLRDDYLGEKMSHATVIKRLSELLGDNKIYQFGIRSGLKAEIDYAEKHQYIEKYTVNTVSKIVKDLKEYPIYVTVDLDVLDPSIMHGTGTPEAGGITFKELHNAILELTGLNIVGCDVVELAPNLDSSKVSTLVAAKLIREMLLII